MPHSTAPLPSAVAHLKAHDAAGWVFFLSTVSASVAGIVLSATGHPVAWTIGQMILSCAFVEWFVLLHECGHGTLFASRRLNLAAGSVAGFCAVIPFRIWVRVHGRHHKWTGWQDIDPTTEALSKSTRSSVARALVNVCWRWWIPLFSVLYRLGNFWNLPRLLRLFPSPAVRTEIVRSALQLTTLYLLLIVVAGPVALIKMTGAALIAALVVEDLLLVSQHTHVPMERAGGRDVRPFPAMEQEVYTRSVRLPSLLSRVALHVDAHELHHMYPFVPGYRLAEVGYRPLNEISWRRWVPLARAMPGEVLLFQDRHESGVDL